MNKTISLLISGTCLTLMLTSCAPMQTNRDKGTAIGAGVGAGLGAALGQAIGRNRQSTLWGAGIGAALGGITGNQAGQYMDYQEQELRAIAAQSEAASIRRSSDILTATFRSETFFDRNSSRLKPGAKRELSRVATILNKYPNTAIKIGGHTDFRGSEQHNRQLSTRRAKTVKNYLVRAGVSSHRISTYGHGESHPISSNHALNRRVEIVIVPLTA